MRFLTACRCSSAAEHTDTLFSCATVQPSGRRQSRPSEPREAGNESSSRDFIVWKSLLNCRHRSLFTVVKKEKNSHTACIWCRYSWSHELFRKKKNLLITVNNQMLKWMFWRWGVLSKIFILKYWILFTIKIATIPKPLT